MKIPENNFSNYMNKTNSYQIYPEDYIDQEYVFDKVLAKILDVK